MSEREDGLKAQGELLATWRAKQKGEDGKRLSQSAAAALVGATQGAWAAWEKGRKAPDPFFAGPIEKLTRGQVKAKGWVFRRSSSAPKIEAIVAKAS